MARASVKYGVERALIRAHIKVESDFNPYAVNPSDPSYGLMGITPQLAQDYGVVYDYMNPTAQEIAKLKDPEMNISIGTRYLAKLHKEYEFDVATQMYNCGITGYLKNGVRVPEYLAKIKRYYNEFRT